MKKDSKQSVFNCSFELDRADMVLFTKFPFCGVSPYGVQMCIKATNSKNTENIPIKQTC